MRRLILLGASGSIGSQTLEVVEAHQDLFVIVGMSIGSQLNRIEKILEKHPAIKYICVKNGSECAELANKYQGISFYSGDEGLVELAKLNDYDLLVNAVVGFRGFLPSVRAIENQKDVALANKESLVAGSGIIKKALIKYNVNLYPIDSEHSAIFQCLQGNKVGNVDALIITASGGSFRDKARCELSNVSVEEALNHPNWKMGGRITIDSATMMNKGFEVIEANALFDIDYNNIEVLIHRESIVHSMVRYIDQAVIAQMGSADMRLPIQYALSFPNRIQMVDEKPFDFTAQTLHFEKVKEGRYPLLELAFEVGRRKGNLGAVLNAADEYSVELFLQNKIKFLDIEKLVIECVKEATYIENPSINDIIASDTLARRYIENKVKEGL